MNQIELIKTKIKQQYDLNYAKATEWESKEDRHNYGVWYEGKVEMCRELLSILDAIEEQPVCEGLEEEIKSFAFSFYQDNGNLPMVADIARHFAQWGAEHRGSSETTKDLEEAAEISFDEAKSLTEGYMYFLAKGLKENHPRPIGPHWFCEYAKNRFIAGAKWQKEKDESIYRKFFNDRNQGDASFYDLLAYREGHRDGMDEQKEQMMKNAMDGEVCPLKSSMEILIPNHTNNTYKIGDNVKIIIIN